MVSEPLRRGAAADKAAAMCAEGQEDFKSDVPTVLEGEVIVTM